MRGVIGSDIFLSDIFSGTVRAVFFLFKSHIFFYNHLSGIWYKKTEAFFKDSGGVLYIIICHVRSNLCNSFYHNANY